MPSDDLHKPLGLDRKIAPRRRRPGWVLPGLLSCVMIGGLILWHELAKPPIDTQTVAAIVAAEPAPPPPAPKPKAPAAHDFVQSAAQVEYESGVKVVRANGGTAPDSMIIEVPHADSLALAPAPDPRLVENSRYGPLPRTGADGARPADVYARPVETGPALKANAPGIVLVIGGLGLNRTITEEAIASLPGGVTFAFAPYGRDLAVSVAQARAAGHEVILQMPMEPLDYPQTDPGPHTLLTRATSAENTDNLHWLMSRFSGYVGIANFLGGKFTADAASLAPVLEEIGERGLIYLDDGTSPQSLAVTLAAQNDVPAVKADLVLDATPDGIDAELVKLEAIARDKGLAIGVASALPESLEKIGRFARAAQSRGLALIPLSAAVSKETPSVLDRGQ
ncbi:MAG: divergent polysaccharide deacetylase family protein [Xanthobacteraceae bacterium]|nr:divergent polysaccharide deacetylase family protein [Xanthobacteraceae bacterium]